MYISFLKENGNEVLVNLDTVDKIEVRPRDGNQSAAAVGTWEVAVFYREKHRLEGPTWVGRYDVAARGSEQDCRRILNNIRASISNNQPIYSL